ncbi:MAG: LysM peptidoglycan-binding domain-containing protein [Gammaproteobacteria bacterium]|mgnify:CR=1 FL=1|nr:MAG: LysM peptidoglycan-binding domain-containing protein [Gammaproteobacteria bacterium]
MKNSSIRNLDFKSRAGDFSFAPKKRSHKAKIGFASVAIASIIGVYSTFFQTSEADAKRSEQTAATASIAKAIDIDAKNPSSLAIPLPSNHEERAQGTNQDNDLDKSSEISEKKSDQIELSLPINAKAPSGFKIPLETSINKNSKPRTLNTNSKKTGSQKQPANSERKTENKNKLNSKIEPKAKTLSLAEEETYKVRKGDTLSSIFKRAKISAKELMLLTKVKHAKHLRKIFPGDKLVIQKTTDGKLGHLHKRIDISQTLVIDLKDDKFVSDIGVDKLDIRFNRISSVIDSSLYLSAKSAGLDDNTIMDLANIFGWDVDFALDIRRGDSFAIIFEEIYRNGELIKNGNIVAAEFVNRGNRFVALRYTDPKGNTSYFTPEGKSMKKAFLRAPVDFRRISSHFKKQRWHPVLGKKRPHRGVDYAASIGTPIKASGDGKIIFRGWKGGYGRTVILKHGSKYTTLYGHMSKYRGGLKTGSRVKQGQIIGYVGKSGLATGPHLHYEFRVNGLHRNPVTVKLPDSAPIAKSYRKDFKSKTANVLAELNTYSKTILALRDN